MADRSARVELNFRGDLMTDVEEARGDLPVQIPGKIEGSNPYPSSLGGKNVPSRSVA